MKKPSITILADPLDDQNAGIHVYTHEAIGALLESDKFDYTLVRQRNTNKELGNAHEIVINSSPSLLYKFFRTFFIIPFKLWKLKPDIVIEPAHFGPFNLPKRIKRVTIIHDLTPIKFPQWHRFHSQLLQRIFLKGILKRASLILTNSENTQIDLKTIYPFTANKSIMIYPGIDPFYFISTQKSVNKKEPFFLNTGTIEPRKNLIVLLEAYTLFRTKNSSTIKMVITGGKGWKSDEFYELLNNHPYKDDIELKGYVSKDELRNLYRTATAFIYPSLYEGFGFPVAEAMSCGTPCIVSKTSSLTEVGGNAVLYFNPNSTTELYERMVEITNSSTLSTELITRGLIQIQNFSWKNFATQLEDELMKLLENKK